MANITCRDTVGRTTDYLEHALDPEARREWESHIERCGHCARYVAQMCIAIRLLASIEPTAATTRSLAD